LVGPGKGTQSVALDRTLTPDEEVKASESRKADISGASAFDSIEMRDGSVLNGDLVSIEGMDVELRVGGTLQHVDRNKIKRVMLVVRSTPVQDLPPTAANP